MRRVIIFLICKRLGLRKYQDFQFMNQKTDAVYYFTEINIMKKEFGISRPSSVSLNWLLDKDCRVATNWGKLVISEHND